MYMTYVLVSMASHRPSRVATTAEDGLKTAKTTFQWPLTGHHALQRRQRGAYVHDLRHRFNGLSPAITRCNDGGGRAEDGQDDVSMASHRPSRVATPPTRCLCT